MRHLITLQPQPPYNFALLLDFLTRFAHPTLNIVADSAYWRVVRVGGSLALVRVTGHGTTAAPRLDIHAAAQTGAPDDAQLVTAIQRILPLAHNWDGFSAAARLDTDLWDVVAPLVGLPEIRSASVFEALAETVIEQQISWVSAQRAQRWLVEWAGNGLPYGGRTFYAFPTPQQVATASLDDLKPLKITFKRMALLIDLATQVANGTLDLEGLRALSPAEAYNRLTAIKGIGHWTAVVTLERAFGYRHWVAHNDVVLQAATNRFLLGGSGRIPPEWVSQTFARYGDHAGLAAYYTMLRWVFEVYPQRGDSP